MVRLQGCEGAASAGSLMPESVCVYCICMSLLTLSFTPHWVSGKARAPTVCLCVCPCLGVLQGDVITLLIIRILTIAKENVCWLNIHVAWYNFFCFYLFFGYCGMYHLNTVKSVLCGVLMNCIADVDADIRDLCWGNDC